MLTLSGKVIDRKHLPALGFECCCGILMLRDENSQLFHRPRKLGFGSNSTLIVLKLVIWWIDLSRSFWVNQTSKSSNGICPCEYVK